MVWNDTQGKQRTTVFHEWNDVPWCYFGVDPNLPSPAGHYGQDQEQPLPDEGHPSQQEQPLPDEVLTLEEDDIPDAHQSESEAVEPTPTDDGTVNRHLGPPVTEDGPLESEPPQSPKGKS